MGESEAGAMERGAKEAGACDIDVIVPNYNYAPLLEEAVRSALDQEGVAVRVLIIDNASTDGSQDVARRLAAADPRIHLLLRETNQGPQSSFNAAIDWAQSPAMMILCSDDVLAPSALFGAVGALRAHPEAAFAYGEDFWFFDSVELPWREAGQAPGDYVLEDSRAFLEARCAGQSFSAMSCVYRTAFRKQAGPYHPDLPFYDDYEMALRLSTFGPPLRTRAYHYAHRDHPQSQTRAWRAKGLPALDQYRDVFEVHFSGWGAQESGKAALMRQVRRRLGAQAFRWAVRAAVRGGFARAADLARGAVDFAIEAPLFAAAEPIQRYFEARNKPKLIPASAGRGT